jgi:hypothetical protein
MFSLSICFGPQGTTWALLFKTEEEANAQWSIINSTPPQHALALKDSFSQQAVFAKREEIHGCMLENLDETKLAHIERTLHELRLKTKLGQVASTDPMIQMGRVSNSPAMLSPAMNGGRGF